MTFNDERPDAAPREANNLPGVSRPNYCPGSPKHSWDCHGDEWRCSFCPAVFRAIRTEGSQQEPVDFETEAAAFRKATGFICPGKDIPAAMNPTDEYMRERRLAWEAWCDGRNYRAALAADVPEGPWWLPDQQPGGPIERTIYREGHDPLDLRGRAEAIAVRDALNRLHAKEKTDG